MFFIMPDHIMRLQLNTFTYQIWAKNIERNGHKAISQNEFNVGRCPAGGMDGMQMCVLPWFLTLRVCEIIQYMAVIIVEGRYITFKTNLPAWEVEFLCRQASCVSCIFLEYTLAFHRRRQRLTHLMRAIRIFTVRYGRSSFAYVKV